MHVRQIPKLIAFFDSERNLILHILDLIKRKRKIKRPPAKKMPVSRTHKLVVLGGERVGKTAIIEQFIFGNHVIGQVSLLNATNARSRLTLFYRTQGGLPTLGDVYEATIETEKGPSEKLHIFDTPGSVRL